MSDIRLYVTTHKKFDHILENEIYIPLQVGAGDGAPTGYLGDDTLDNITHKAIYSEFRGQYWYWKNVHCDIVGLVHYRRHFAKSDIFISFISPYDYETVLDADDVLYYLERYDILVLSVYFKANGTMREHTQKYNYESYLDLTREVLADLCPEYLPCFDQVMAGNVIFPNNMYICKKSLSDEYSEWIFSIFDEIEKRMLATLPDIRPRIMGAIAEVLLKVWIDQNALRHKSMTRLKVDEEVVQYHPLFDHSGYQVHFEPTKEGRSVAKLLHNSKPLYLGSKYSLRSDLSALSGQLKTDAPKQIIVFGLGSGDYIEQLMSAYPNTGVLIIEPLTDTIRDFLNHRKYRALEAFESRLRIIPLDRTLSEKIEACFDTAQDIEVLHYPNYNIAFKNEFALIKGLVLLK